MLTDQWYVNAANWRSSDRGGGEGRHQVHRRKLGRRPTSNGCATSSRGAFRASFGGAIGFRLGTGRTDTSSSRKAKAPRRRRRASITARTSRCTQDEDVLDTWFSSGAVAVLDARLAAEDAGAEAVLPDLHPRHRARHHLLLGRADDDARAALHEGSSVPRSLHPRPGARRARARRCRSPRAT